MKTIVPALLTTAEVAGLCRVSLKVPGRWAAARRVGHLRLPSGRLRYPAAQFSELAAAGPLLTPAEAAARCGVAVQTVSRWRREGRIAGIATPGGCYLYPLSQFPGGTR